MILGEVISELLVGRLLEDGLLPQVGGQVGISGGHGGIGSLSEVTQSASGATGGGVAVVNTGHLQQLLGHGGGDDACSSGGGDEPHPERRRAARARAPGAGPRPAFAPQFSVASQFQQQEGRLDIDDQMTNDLESIAEDYNMRFQLSIFLIIFQKFVGVEESTHPLLSIRKKIPQLNRVKDNLKRI